MSSFVLCGHSAPVWVSRYSASPETVDFSYDIALGRDGSVYVSGFSYPQDSRTLAVVKYSGSGQQLWAVANTNIAPVLGDGRPAPFITLDPGDGVRVAGDWSGATNEIAVVSFSSAGELLWERHFREGFDSHPRALAVDGSSNTIVVGWSRSGATTDALVLKYAANGTLLWSRNYSLLSASTERGYSVATLSGGAILIGIHSDSRGTMVLKYDSDGQLLWAAELGTQTFPSEIAVDPTGAIIVAGQGSSGEDALFKVSAAGELIWRQWPVGIGGSGANDLALDPSGNIYVFGTATAKYDANGVRQWISRFTQPDAFVFPQGIAATESGVSLAFTVFRNAGQFTAVHYNTNGIEVSRDAYLDVTGIVTDMVGDASGGIYLTGGSDPRATADFLTVKFQPDISPNLPVIINPPRSLEVIEGTNGVTFSVETGPGEHTFQWRMDGEAIPDATNATLRVTDIRYGSYSVIVSNAYGYVVTPEALLNVRTPPQIANTMATNAVVVAGNDLVLDLRVSGDAPITYEWRKDGVLLPLTNSVLIIEPVGVGDTGTYTSVARSPYGVATNAPIVVTVVPRTPIDEWRWIRARPQGNTLHAVAFGNGRFVAVGDAGVVLTSTDGLNWAVTNLSRFGLTGVTFGNGLFVAASGSGAIYTSPDGLAWTRRAPPVADYQWQHGVSFINGIFVCYGQELRASTNGVDWFSHGPSPVIGQPLAFGAGRYLISAYGHTMLSTNLTDWRPYIMGPDIYELVSAAYGNGVFVLNNWRELYTSPDGIEVTSRYPVPHAVNVTFVNGRFFAVGETIESSVDGATWSRAASPPGYVLLSVAHGNGIYVAVGDAGAIATSLDGQTWARTPRRPSTLRGLAYGGGRYVAVGDQAVLTSTDGQSWTSITGPTLEEPTAIKWGNGTFVVAGRRGELLTSRDGLSWTRQIVHTSDVRDLIHDGTRFVAVAGQETLISTNGLQWAYIPPPPIFEAWSLGALGFGDGVYVGSLYWLHGFFMSTNAINWDIAESPPPATSFAYGNGTFVGMTSWGAFVSTNGLNWTMHQIADGYVFESVVFGGGTFVAGAGADGSIAASANGRDWVVHRPRPQVPWGRIAYANGAFWIVGSHEAIIRSVQIEPAIRARKTATGLELTVRAYPDRSYRLQRATALGSWSDFQTFTPQTETTIFTDNNTSASAFYRILSP